MTTAKTTTTKAAAQPLNLRQKLAAVAKSLGDVKPDGYNAFYKYKYFSDEQLSGLFRQKFADAGIVLVPNIISEQIESFQTEKGKHSFLTTMRVMWTFYDADSDETIVASTPGQGDDPGDKGSNKAMTGSFKYLLIKMFQIGGEQSDAEADTKTDERHEEKKAARKSDAAKPEQKVENVQKGGRQANASEPQVDRVSRLAKELGIGMGGLVNVIKNSLGVDVELPEDDKEKGPFMRSFFENLTADEIGKVAQALETATERAKDV